MPSPRRDEDRGTRGRRDAGDPRAFAADRQHKDQDGHEGETGPFARRASMTIARTVFPLSVARRAFMAIWTVPVGQLIPYGKRAVLPFERAMDLNSLREKELTAPGRASRPIACRPGTWMERMGRMRALAPSSGPSRTAPANPGGQRRPGVRRGDRRSDPDRRHPAGIRTKGRFVATSRLEAGGPPMRGSAIPVRPPGNQLQPSCLPCLPYPSILLFSCDS